MQGCDRFDASERKNFVAVLRRKNKKPRLIEKAEKNRQLKCRRHTAVGVGV